MASFHGSPLVRNGSTAKPGTNVSVAMFNGYDDSGVKPEAKAAVQVRAAPCLAGGVYAGALHAIIFSHVQVAPVAMSSFQTNSHVINGILAVFDPSLSSTRTCWTVGTGGCQRKVELNDLLAADSCERTLLWAPTSWELWCCC